MIYAVIDTNIFVSALLKKDSLPDMIVHHIYARNIIPVFNDEIFAEYEEVLYRQKFHFPKEAVKFTLDRMREIGSIDDGKEKTNHVSHYRQLETFSRT